MFAPTQFGITMLKLGFLFKSEISNNQIDKIISETGCQLAGVFTGDSSIHSDIDDLLSSCDILFIACTNERKFEIASRAIKKGVVPIINNIDGLNSSTLSQLQQLANEIGIKFCFVDLGHNFDGYRIPFENPFIGNLKRYTSKPISDEATFQQYLIYDIATALKFSKLDVRKVRAYGLPICSNIPQSLMVMVDFGNNSVFTYNLQQTKDIDQLEYEISTGKNCEKINILTTPYSSENLAVETSVKAISGIFNRSESVNTIELALEATKLVDTILSKINL
jgi:hypothetical protein